MDGGNGISGTIIDRGRDRIKPNCEICVDAPAEWRGFGRYTSSPWRMVFSVTTRGSMNWRR
jgi:hypothetical protein